MPITHMATNPRNTQRGALTPLDRKSTRLNSSHLVISYAVFCLKKYNTSTTHASRVVIGTSHITLNAIGGGLLPASNQFRHGAPSKRRSNTASNSPTHHSPLLSG